MSAPEFSAVGETARRGDPARFEAALFAPVERRERLFALIALNVELSRIPETVSDPMLGEIRLQWWIDAIEAVFDAGAEAGHEVISALAEPIAAGASSREMLLSLVEARRFALADQALTDDAMLDRFLADTGGAMSALQVLALGGDAAAAGVAAKAGWAEGAGRLIGALPALMSQGVSAVPVQGGFDVNAALSGETPPKLKSAVTDLAVRAIERLEDARAGIKSIPKDCRAPLLSVRAQERRLRAILLPGADIFTDTGAVSPFREKISLFKRALTSRF